MCEGTGRAASGNPPPSCLKNLRNPENLLPADQRRRRDELGAGIRSFPFESHVVFNTETGDGIAVIRLLHKRQYIGRYM